MCVTVIFTCDNASWCPCRLLRERSALATSMTYPTHPWAASVLILGSPSIASWAGLGAATSRSEGQSQLASPPPASLRSCAPSERACSWGESTFLTFARFCERSRFSTTLDANDTHANMPTLQRRKTPIVRVFILHMSCFRCSYMFPISVAVLAAIPPTFCRCRISCMKRKKKMAACCHSCSQHLQPGSIPTRQKELVSACHLCSYMRESCAQQEVVSILCPAIGLQAPCAQQVVESILCPAVYAGQLAPIYSVGLPEGMRLRHCFSSSSGVCQTAGQLLATGWT